MFSRNSLIQILHRLTSVCTLLAVLTTYSLPAFAQSISASDMLARWDSPDASMPAPRKFDPATLLRQDKGGLSEGRVAGEALADEIDTGDQFLLGIAIMFGFFPLAIPVYKRQKPSSMTAEALAKYVDGNDLYKVGFKEGWDRKTQSKKKKAFLKGVKTMTAVTGVALGGVVLIFASTR
jgi:hypothetical protein